MAGIPAVVSRRVDNPQSRIGAALRYRAFAKVIAVSRHVSDILEDSGLHQDRQVLIRSAVARREIMRDDNRARIREQFDIAPNCVALAAAGQFIARKGHRFLLQALAGTSLPDCRLVLFGRGPLEQDLRAMADAAGLHDRVEFAGFRDDFDTLLPAFDVLLHPATREGLGISMLKAAMARLPVVAFDVAGAREAVQHGQTGLLVPTADVAALAAAIAALAGDPAERARMGDAGRQRMLSDFSVDAMVDAHIDLYQSVLDG